jgi:hypothetical protein
VVWSTGINSLTMEVEVKTPQTFGNPLADDEADDVTFENAASPAAFVAFDNVAEEPIGFSNATVAAMEEEQMDILDEGERCPQCERQPNSCIMPAHSDTQARLRTLDQHSGITLPWRQGRSV